MTAGGVEGTGSTGSGVAGFTQSGKSQGVYGFGAAQSAGLRGESIAGPGAEAHSSAGPGVRGFTVSGAVSLTAWWPATSTAAFGKVTSRGFAAGAVPRSSWSRSPARGAGCAPPAEPSGRRRWRPSSRTRSCRRWAMPSGSLRSPRCCGSTSCTTGSFWARAAQRVAAGRSQDSSEPKEWHTTVRIDSASWGGLPDSSRDKTG
jgi:hypothetical protein